MGCVCVRGWEGVWLALSICARLLCKKKKNIIIETLGQAHKPTRAHLTPRTHAGGVKLITSQLNY